MTSFTLKAPVFPLDLGSALNSSFTIEVILSFSPVSFGFEYFLI